MKDSKKPWYQLKDSETKWYHQPPSHARQSPNYACFYGNRLSSPRESVFIRSLGIECGYLGMPFVEDMHRASQKPERAGRRP
jgi:hypothetical protein